MTVAILGVGAVGGMIAARTGGICIPSSASADAILDRGLRVEAPEGAVTVHPEVVARLERRVDLLVVSVKAHQLEAALERVDPCALDGSSVVLPLLNGLEHVAAIRGRLAWPDGHGGPTVLAGSIGSFEAFVVEPGRILQRSNGAVVTVASDALAEDVLSRALAPLRVPGIDVVIGASERAVLWQKAARLSVLAAATIASGRPLGELRDDERWCGRLRAALDEACATAAVEGVVVDPTAQWAIIETMPAQLTTSAARDAAVGARTELDAITGAVVRAAARAGMAVPVLRALLDDAEAACRAQ